MRVWHLAGMKSNADIIEILRFYIYGLSIEGQVYKVLCAKKFTHHRRQFKKKLLNFLLWEGFLTPMSFVGASFARDIFYNEGQTDDHRLLVGASSARDLGHTVASEARSYRI